MKRIWTVLTLISATCALGQIQMQAQEKGNTGGDDAGMDMAHPPDSMHSMAGMHAESNGAAAAMQSMQGQHMDRGAHMKMTALRPMHTGDKEKAAEVEQAARQVAEKYLDYKVALADGYKIFLPNIPQKQYHFTNYRNAYLARDHFDASLPTSLLYQKDADGFKLVGVMYTARKDATEDELDARIPLSIAQWHAHVNLCVPARGQREEVIQPGHKFGLNGSIATKEECETAGGHFFPQVFGWMVHVYPFEKNAADIWSVERQHKD